MRLKLAPSPWRLRSSRSVASPPAGDSDYLPPEEAAAHQTKQHGLLQNLTSPLRKEASGEYDQKLVHTLISAHHNVRYTSFFPTPCLQVQDRVRRFDFLLQQTEIFTHFINMPGGKKTPSSPLKVTPPTGLQRRERKRHPSAST